MAEEEEKISASEPEKEGAQPAEGLETDSPENVQQPEAAPSEAASGEEPADADVTAQTDADAQPPPDSADGKAEEAPGDDSDNDMEHWAADQLAAIGDEEEQEKDEEDEEKKPKATAAPEQAVSGGTALRPFHIFLFILLALLPVASVAVVLSIRHETAQKNLYEGFERQLRQMEKRLTLLKAADRESSYVAEESSDPVGDFKSLVEQGNSYFADGKYDEACRTYQAAIESAPSDAVSSEARYNLGTCLAKAAKDDEAREQFRMLLSGPPGGPHYAHAALQMAQLLVKKKDYSQARRLLYQVVAVRDRLAPDELACVERAYYGIARCFDEGGRIVKKARLSSVTASNPDELAGSED